MTWADDTDRAIDKLLDRELATVFDRGRAFTARDVAYTLRNFRTLYVFSIADKLNQHKNKILRSIEYDLLKHHEYIYGVFREIVELQALGAAWPELIEILEKHKSHIIKTLLSKYKGFYKKSDILAFLESLEQIGITWPELAAIEKSAKSDLTESDNTITPQERYVIDKLFPGTYYVAIASLSTWPVLSVNIQAALEKQKKHLIAYLKGCIAKDQFSTFFKAVRAFKVQQIAWPELDELVEASKRPFIVKLLTKLKNHQDSTDLIYIETVIKDARRVVDWPELSVIKSHALAELDDARDQGIPGYEPDPFDDELRGN
jgi:hypothetical protein